MFFACAAAVCTNKEATEQMQLFVFISICI